MLPEIGAEDNLNNERELFALRARDDLFFFARTRKRKVFLCHLW